MIKKVIKYLTDKDYRFVVDANRGKYNTIPDKEYLEKMFRVKLGYELNLENPKTYCEKCQWLKLYDRKPIYTKMVDKYEAKKFAEERIGKEHIIPTYGIWDSFDAIDFDKLPEQFILKCTHNSGSFVICKEKETFDKKAAKKILEKGLKNNYFLSNREWPYKDVKPRIIAEKYIDALGKRESIEYKTTCFNGKVAFVTICTGIAHAAYELRTNDSFDIHQNHMPWYAFYKNAEKTPKIPQEWNEIIQLSEKLAEGTPLLRVDCYVIDGQILFGEMTFYTWAGFPIFTPREWDRKLGEMIKLPQI